MKILKNTCLAALLSLTAIGNTAVAAGHGDGGPFAAENFSATLTMTTNYTFRGTTFSDKGAAIQGSFDWGYGPFFAGVWGTSTNPNDDNGVGGTLEVDWYFGWADNVSGFDLMLMPLFYTFPDQHGRNAREDLTFELWTAVGRSFEGMPGSPYVNIEFNYSPEYFDGGDRAYYVRPSIAFSLANDFGFDVGYGHQNIGDENEFFADDYGHIDVGITKSIFGFDLDFRYHHNFDDDELGEDFALDDFVFSISRSF